MAEILNYIIDILRNFIRVFYVRKIDNSLNIFVKSNTGNTLSVNLDPSWEVKEIKNIIAPKLGAYPEEVKIIFAGKELLDSTIIQECDLGEQSILHVVRLKSTDFSNRRVNAYKTPILECDVDVSESMPETETSSVSQFYVYCSACKGLKPGKLRVRCNACKSGAITVDSDPKSWDDVLRSKAITGHCEQDGCLGGAASWAEFYFKCGEHIPRNESENSSFPLKLIRSNNRNVPCLACTEIKDIVFVFRCEESHVTCVDCFISYASIRLRERQFVLTDKFGYTLPCPVGCPDSFIEECHHFKLLNEAQYALYQKFATEEFVLKAGGVLCPQPACGEGIIIDQSCNKVACINGCGYVFCRNCLQGYHIGPCKSRETNLNSEDVTHITDPLRAAQARWEEASNIAIRITTKPCPKCRTATERDGGCMHMICTRCSFHWCWVCQIEWNRECMGAHWFGHN